MKAARAWPDDGSSRRLAAPEGWEVVEVGGRGERIGHGGGGIWLERTWARPNRRWLHLAIVLVCLASIFVGTGMLAEADWKVRRDRRFFSGAALRSYSSTSGTGVVLILLGLPVGYVFLARALNRTRIEARSGRLTIRHRPLPWRGVRELAGSDVEQVFCELVPRLETYRILASVRGRGAPLLLVEGLPTAREALFVESRLEIALGIPDRRVDGELIEKRVFR